MPPLCITPDEDSEHDQVATLPSLKFGASLPTPPLLAKFGAGLPTSPLLAEGLPAGPDSRPSVAMGGVVGRPAPTKVARKDEARARRSRS